MKAREIAEVLFGFERKNEFNRGRDGLKWGDPEKEVRKVVVSMFNTVEIIRKAMALDADMVIVHEPTFYANSEPMDLENEVDRLKKELLDESGITFYRNHDHSHDCFPDLIAKGTANLLDLDCETEFPGPLGLVRFHLKKPMTAEEIALHLQEKLHTRKLHIAGDRKTPCTEFSLFTGSPGQESITKELRRKETQILAGGEIYEWCHGEYTRDAKDLGFIKALIPLGHVGSEWGGMKLICEMMQEKLPQIEFVYVEDGDPFCEV